MGRAITRLASLDEHAVPVRVEPVLLFDGMPVGLHNGFDSSERAHQHQKAGLREMKVCQKSADDAEPVAGIDKQIGLTPASLHLPVSGLSRRIFQGAHGSGPDCDQSTSGDQSTVDGCGCFRGNLIRLGMQSMVFNPIYADWLKCPKAYVQSDFHYLNTT